MAVLAIRLGEHARHYMGIVLLFLHLSIAMMNLIMVGLGIGLAVLFSQQKAILNNFNYKKHTHFIIFSSIILIIIHLIGAKLFHDCSSVITRLRILNYVVPYIGVLFGAYVLTMALSISCSVAVRSLEKGHEKGFKDLMGKYDVDGNARKEIDTMQISNKCCGSTSYQDWIEISWHSDEYIRPELQSTKGRGVPFTCCDPAYMGPCLHDSGEHKRPGYNIVEKGQAFYSSGCSETVSATLRLMLSNLAIWILLPAWLEVVAMVVAKYLHSSAQNAIDCGDESSKGFGFLMDSCPISCLSFLDCDIYGMQMKQKLAATAKTKVKKAKKKKKTKK